MIRTEDIKNLATCAGFDLCGVSPCKHLAENEVWFRERLASGMLDPLGYLGRHLDKRFDTRRLMDRAQTVVVCGVSYKNRTSEGYPAGFRTKVASYACTHDYHNTIRTMLTRMLDALQAEYPGVQGRAFVDTAPLLEKQLAVEAGLGWIGRQSLLVTPRFGTFVLLGELLLTEPADAYDSPFEGARCGRCRNCIDTCPTGAIVAPRSIDTRRCIACHTIEREQSTEVDLHGWIFGCDACQSCCPYGQKAPTHTNPAFDPLFDPLAMNEDVWQSLTEEEFAERFGTTPMTRSGIKRIKSNIR